MILLADEANATKKGGQELIGGLHVRVHRNYFGRQVESFIADLRLPFLEAASADAAVSHPYPGVFIRAPIVEAVLSTDAARGSAAPVEVLGVLPGRRGMAGLAGASAVAPGADDAGDIVSVRQGNSLGTSFHPEMTDDDRIHAWWLAQVVQSLEGKS